MTVGYDASIERSGDVRGVGSRPALELRGVSMSFRTNDGPLPVLDDVDLTVGAGEFVTILGPSGCGKSTALRLITHLERPTSGEIVINGQQTTKVSPHVGMMFQADTLLPWATVEDNISLGLTMRDRSAPKEARATRIAELVDLVQLSGFEGYHPYQLSGGMRKRVALAQLLAYDPDIFLMDEPFAALDAQTKIKVETEFLNIWQRLEKSVLFITHDVEEAIALSDRVLVMGGRPGTIRSEFRIELPRPRDFYEIRFDNDFREIQQEIWQELRHVADG